MGGAQCSGRHAGQKRGPHCEIVIYRGRLMFVDFVGFSYPRIYVPTCI